MGDNNLEKSTEIEEVTNENAEVQQGEGLMEAEPEEDLEAMLKRINMEREGVTPQEIIEVDEEPQIKPDSKVLFKTKSDIGKDDHRAFIYHSVFFKTKWLLPAYIIVPPIIGLVFSLVGGRVEIITFIISTLVSYALILGMTVFRTERSLKKSAEKNPNLMMITPTTFTFYNEAIVNSKKTGEVSVPYRQLIRVCETKQRFILYFDNKKAMVIRKEDIMRDADIEAFRTFINLKVAGGI